MAWDFCKRIFGVMTDRATGRFGKYRVQKLPVLYCPPDISIRWEERVCTVGSDDNCILLGGRPKGIRANAQENDSKKDLTLEEVRSTAELFS